MKVRVSVEVRHRRAEVLNRKAAASEDLAVERHRASTRSTATRRAGTATAAAAAAGTAAAAAAARRATCRPAAAAAAIGAATGRGHEDLLLLVPPLE